MKDLYIIVVNLMFFTLWKNKKNIEQITTRIVEWKIEIGKIIFLFLNIVYGIFISEDINILINKLLIRKLVLYKKPILFNSEILTSINEENSIPIIIGAISLMLALFIYIVSENDNLKKELIKTSIDIKKLIYLSLIIFAFMFFNGRSIFLISGYLYTLILMYDSFRIKIIINKNIYSEEELIFLMKKIERITDEEKEGIYLEMRNKIVESINNNSFYLENIIKFWGNFIENNFKFIEKESYENNIIMTIREIYELVKEKKNDRIFSKCYYLHIILAEIAYNNKKKEMFYESLLLKKHIYRYYLNSKEKRKLAEKVIDGLKYKFDILNDFKNDFNLGKEWLAVFYRVINKLVEESYINNDEVFFDYFLKIIKYKVEYCDEKKYNLLGCANYFGLLLLLNKSKNKKEPQDKFLNILKEKFNYELSYEADGKTLFDLYLFIKEQNIKELLEWDKVFEPKQDLVELRFYNVITDNEINKLFLVFLYEESDIDRNYIINQIKGYKENNRYTYDNNYRLMESLAKMEPKYQEKLGNIFKEIDQEFKIKEKQQITKEKISIKRIEKIKETISGVLKENWILDNFFRDKIEIKLKEQGKKRRSLNVFCFLQLILAAL